jgi:tricorn protease
MRIAISTALGVLLAAASSLSAQERAIRLPLEPRITPDGNAAVFVWQGDLWHAPLDGALAGQARRLTVHPSADRSPIVSPDGQRIVFVSDRDGGAQMFEMRMDGSAVRALTADTLGRQPIAFTADGRSLLVRRSTDRGAFGSESARAFLMPLDGESPERMLVDFGVGEVALSADGTHLLFTRGRADELRKGFLGASALQIWKADLSTSPPGLVRHSADRDGFQNVSERDPMWSPDGKGYWFVSDPEGTWEVYWRDLASGTVKQVSRVGADGSDDGVLAPSVSADGKRILFQRRFDLFVLDTQSGAVKPVVLRGLGDEIARGEERRRVSAAIAIAFTKDGKQMAFTAGHDVWVMDRVLAEPVRVTDTPAIESDLLFSEDGKRLFFVSEASGEVDVWEASCGRDDGVWWRAAAMSFPLRKVTDDAAVERGLRASPTGEHVGYVRNGDLYVMDNDGTDHRRVVAGWDGPSFDWSPDGKWLCYSREDDDFNDDVWIVPLDGSRAPYNLSRHPDDDARPVWSPDGTRIAWSGRRDGEETDIWVVTLSNAAAEETSRDRKLEKAIAAMDKKGARKPDDGRAAGRGGSDRSAGAKPEVEKTDDNQSDDKKSADPSAAKKPVVIDFDGIHRRIQRIAIPESTEGGLIWSPDGKKLGFSARVGAESGFFTVTFPDELTPKKLASSGLASARWLAEGDQIVGLGSGGGGDAGGGRGPRGGGRFGGGGGATPASLDAKSGRIETFGFSVLEVRDWRAVRQLAFDQGWRAMRDRFYDHALNNRDWNAIRAKYRPVAAELLGADEFSRLMNMMLGELNASHMGHRGGAEPMPSPAESAGWSMRTFHLGLRFAEVGASDALVVQSVIPGGPCSQARSRVNVGERVLSVDGVAVADTTSLARALTMPQEREVELRVRDREGNERTVKVTPTGSVAGLLYDEFVDATRAQVEKLSEGKVGYLHIRGMDQSSFVRFEEDLYHAGVGKDALIIDVRWNGGGSTADHVLTALTQPRHAIAVPRNGGPGYPQDRKIYATWQKPIVVMCNEFSFSNAEILSHAVKTLRRGKVVGMRTGGGVISTGSVGLLDGSSVRMPFRGWYLLNDGADMELNGCLPDIALWNTPGGEDAQLAAAVRSLLDDLAKAQKDPALVPAASLRK